jgi:hypothetical protein
MTGKTKNGAQRDSSERPRCIGAAGPRILPLFYSTLMLETCRGF